MSHAAVQLYTVREHTKTARDFADSLQKLAGIGYQAVQLSTVGAMSGNQPEVNADAARRMLDDHNIRCVATHRAWSDLASRTDDEIQFHHTLGCDFTAIGGIPNDYGADGADGYQRFVDDARPVIEKLKNAGIRFGHHNHAHEFQRTAPSSDKTLFDILIEQGGLDYCLEIDVYWAWHAGMDPVQLFDRCQNRVPVVHIKDKQVLPDEGPAMAPIGEGNLPWNTILPAGNHAGVAWWCVEQDRCYRDAFDSLRASFEFLQSRGINA